MFEIGRLTRLNLGRVGENNARAIEIDVTEWLAEWPGAAIGMLLRRPGEDTYYVASAYVRDGVMHYTPTRADVEIPGEGMAQIVLTGAGDVELRSKVVETRVEESMPGSAAPVPEEPMQPFVGMVIEAAKRAEDAAERAESAGGGGGGGGGEPGQDGFSPIARVQETSDGAVITITDKTGTTTAEVHNGKDGEPGQPGEPGEKGEPGDPGVYVGTNEPTDPDVIVWVDPSGEADGDFDVVKTVNVSQDGVAEIVEDGLALRKALITVYLPAGDASLNLNANVYMTDGTTGLYANISGAQATAARYTKLRADVANGAFELKVQAPTAKESNTAGMNAYGCIVAAGYVNKVRLYMGSSKPFPNGAWIKIEGVSAYA